VHPIHSMSGSRAARVFGVGGSNDAISGSIISKMADDGHLEITALSRVTLASAGLSCYFLFYDTQVPFRIRIIGLRIMRVFIYHNTTMIAKT